MKVVQRFSSGIEAQLSRSKLQSEGILSFVFDEQINTINPLYNIATGGIRLMVHEDDFDQAKNILEQLKQAPFESKNEEVIRCTKCGQTELMRATSLLKNKKGVIVLFLSFLMMIFPIYSKQVFICRSCGHEFDA